jgi:hypothetical protein
MYSALEPHRSDALGIWFFGNILVACFGFLSENQALGEGAQSFRHMPVKGALFDVVFIPGRLPFRRFVGRIPLFLTFKIASQNGSDDHGRLELQLFPVPILLMLLGSCRQVASELASLADRISQPWNFL